MSELKVLHVIPAVAPRYGGPSKAIFEMCRALQMQGADVLIATTDGDGRARLPVKTGTPITYQGVQTVFFSRRWSERFGYSPALARWMADNVSAFDAAHIHAVFSHPCLAAARACQRRGVPYLVRPLGSLDPWSMSQKPVRKRLLWSVAAGRMLREAAAVHYTTSEERLSAEGSLGLMRGAVIPLGIEMEELHDPLVAGVFRRRNPSLGEHPYVLALSRIHQKKNIELLIEVFVSLAKRAGFEDWRLVIAGDGEAAYMSSLQSLAEREGGKDRIIFTGWLDGPERISALQNAALFALTSRQENFGLAVVEALACGVPVLVSDHVNLAPEIEKAGAGWVTSLGAADFSRALSEALFDENERGRRGRAGRDFVRQRFSWPQVANELIELYIQVAKRNLKLKAEQVVS